MQNQLREGEIVFDYVAAIGAGGVGARALMKDCFDSIGQQLALDGARELPRLHEIREPQIAKVAEVVAKAIHHDHVGDALGIQRAEQVTADEACTAGNYDHRFPGSRSRISRTSRLIVAAGRARDHYPQAGYSSRGLQIELSAPRFPRREPLRECAHRAMASRAAYLELDPACVRPESTANHARCGSLRKRLAAHDGECRDQTGWSVQERER